MFTVGKCQRLNKIQNKPNETKPGMKLIRYKNVKYDLTCENAFLRVECHIKLYVRNNYHTREIYFHIYQSIISNLKPQQTAEGMLCVYKATHGLV
jgi:hypothetical protein